MKRKRFLAIATAVVMLVPTTLTAYADDLTEQTINSDAGVNYVDPSSYVNVVVPTSETMAFTLDPQNLAATQGAGVWNPEAGGSILPASVITIANKSAVPIKTTVSVSLTDDAENPSVLVDSDEDINEGTDKKMYLTLTPANDKTTLDADEIEATEDPVYVGGETPVEFAEADLLAAGVDPAELLAYDAGDTAEFGQFVESEEDSEVFYQVEVPVITATIDATTKTTVAEFNDAGSGLASTDNTSILEENGTNLLFVLNSAEYYVSKTGSDYELVYREADTNTNYDTASFIIGGKINKNADWSGYGDTANISLSATYTFETMKESEATTALASKLVGSYNSLEYIVDAAPSIETTALDWSKTTGATVTVDLGKGSLAATGIASVATTVTGTSYAWATGTWSFSGDTLTLSKTAPISSIAVDQTRTITVTFNDEAQTTATFVVTIKN